MRKINYIFLPLLIIFFAVGLFFINTADKKNNERQINLSNKIYMPQKNLSPSSIIILPSTKIVYDYYYEEDGCVESTSEYAPHFLIGMKENELKNIFSDWQVKNFSKEKVVMQKNISGLSYQHYVIGIKDGYVAVFYQNQVNGTNLKEITNTPVSSLTADDRKRLEEGIKISGEDKLIAILQDYES